MEGTEMWLLAATRAESAAAALFLAVVSSCFLLLIYRPTRTEFEGTPHRVPPIAFMIALGWLILMAGASLGTEPAPEKETLTLYELWIECAVQLGVTTIVASAYVFSRRPDSSRPAADLSPAPESPKDSLGDDLLAPPAPPKNRILPDDWPHHLAVGLTVGLAALLPTSLLGQILAPDRETGDTHILLRTLAGKGWDYLLPIIIAAAILAPLLEELLFRVIIQGWFADRIGKLAIPLTAGVFALVHRTSDAALLVPLALILGTLFEYRRSYLEVVAAHAAFNGANLFAAVNVL
jgi:hypothetical protein